jgi:hypothetical protein
VHRPLPSLLLFSLSRTELPTVLRLRQEDDNSLFVAAVARFRACLLNSLFSRELQEIRYLAVCERGSRNTISRHYEVSRSSKQSQRNSWRSKRVSRKSEEVCVSVWTALKVFAGNRTNALKVLCLLDISVLIKDLSSKIRDRRQANCRELHT